MDSKLLELKSIVSKLNSIDNKIVKPAKKQERCIEARIVNANSAAINFGSKHINEYGAVVEELLYSAFIEGDEDIITCWKNLVFLAKLKYSGGADQNRTALINETLKEIEKENIQIREYNARLSEELEKYHEQVREIIARQNQTYNGQWTDIVQEISNKSFEDFTPEQREIIPAIAKIYSKTLRNCRNFTTLQQSIDWPTVKAWNYTLVLRAIISYFERVKNLKNNQYINNPLVKE